MSSPVGIPKHKRIRIRHVAVMDGANEGGCVERNLAELEADTVALGGDDGVLRPWISAEGGFRLAVAEGEADTAGIEEEPATHAANLLHMRMSARHDRGGVREEQSFDFLLGR